MADPLAPCFANTPVSAGRPRFDYAPRDECISPSVSIITPYYDTGEVFLETAQSVLQQSLQYWEWLIVNDGSKSRDALRVLASFREGDPRIHVIDQMNQGPPSARNRALDDVKSDLIFFLDSDDLLEPTALEKMTWFLESHPEFHFCKGHTVSFGGKEYLSDKGFDSTGLFLSKNPITISSMIRRQAIASVGGFDETLVDGLEDWDFWLRCAAQAKWGGTIPEYLDWYRRRKDHSERWAEWTASGLKRMQRRLRQRYPELYADGIPQVNPRPAGPYEDVSDSIPFDNILAKRKRRILMMIPWMAMGGADKFNLDLIAQLNQRGYEVSIVTTLNENYQWYRQFANLTPDIFILPNFLRMTDYPRFLRYLIRSRQIDVVMISNSELGYMLLPYLRSRCPDTTFVDYCHMEEEYWKNGGYPRMSASHQELLDMNIVSSQHLRQWMIDRGADACQIEVCYTNIDTESHSPDEGVRKRVREELNISSTMPLLLYAGRLCEQKQPRVFARVMRELQSRELDFVCLVAGDGEDRDWLRWYLNRHFLRDKVRMLGAVSNERVLELLAASDVFFLPSKMEGISLTIYEAMALGVVPVGADVGGQREVVTPECGILIERGTQSQEVTAYADALESLIRSPDVRTSLADSARERVSSRFRLEEMGDRMAFLLESSQRLHGSRPKPEVGPGLGLECAVQAIEYQRLSKSAARLWRYHSVEVLRERSARVLLSWMDALKRLASYFLRPIRKAKDTAWICAHRLKTFAKRI